VSRRGVADRLILNELHPNEFKLLRREFVTDAAVATHNIDGLATLTRHLPPTTPHGFVFIDPPYEHKDEMGKVDPRSLYLKSTSISVSEPTFMMDCMILYR
jgi:23S rRNA A2030 N6-methylase RlmJ